MMNSDHVIKYSRVLTTKTIADCTVLFAIHYNLSKPDMSEFKSHGNCITNVSYVCTSSFMAQSEI